MGKTVNHEIERKFLIKELPTYIDFVSLNKSRITQCYLNGANDEIEVRARRYEDHVEKGVKERYYLDIKSKGSKIRLEVGLPIVKEQFDNIYSEFKTIQVVKMRYKVPSMTATGKKIFLDVYEGHLKGYICAEFEGETEKIVDDYKPEPWFTREITGEKAYKNRYIAINGLPREVKEFLKVRDEEILKAN